MKSGRKNTRRVILGTLFFALMFLYLGVHAYFAFVDVGSYDGWFGEQTRPGQPVRITGSDPNGPAKAVRAGDRLIAINGLRPEDNLEVVGMSGRVPPGTTLVLTIERDGQELTIPITTAPAPKRNNWGEKAYILIHLLFLAISLAIFVLKSDDDHAWLLSLFLATFIGLSGWNMPLGVLGSGVAWLVSIARILSLWSLPLFVRFFLVFPERSPILKRWPALERYVSLPFYLFVLPLFGGGRLPSHVSSWYFNLDPIRWLADHNWFGLPFPVIVVYLAAGLVCLVVNYRAATQDARRRLHVVMIGSGAGFLSYLLVVIAEYLGLNRRAPVIATGLELAMLCALPFIPLSFAYAIVKHKVIPISLIVRRSARYVLVSRGAAVLVMAAVSLAMYFLMDTIFTYFLRVGGRLVGVISAVLAIVVWNLAYSFHQRVVAPIVDRRFFRESYDARQILSELSQSVRSTTDISQLLELVASRIHKALHVSNVTVLLRDATSGTFKSAVSFDPQSSNNASLNGPETSISLPGDAQVVQRLSESIEPLKADLTDTGSWLSQRLASGDNGSFASERDSLERMNTELLLPITAKGGMLGIISLGPRLGDQPFSKEDQQLLMSVVGQTTFAIENARLIERVIEDGRRRQELEADNAQRARELEEARQLQISMLPSVIPQLPNLEIAAYMKPATEVGGDYYDFHLEDDGTLTVAVGDATGHGLKAGTMVTAVKSLFAAFAHQPDVVSTLEQFSGALRKMNLRRLFMAMTIVKIRGLQLTISIAGMPPVLVYRAATGVVDEIAISAMPLGSFANYRYRKVETTIGAGDAVVIMSDGLPERFNAQNEMLDYTATRSAFAEAASQSSEEIIEALVKAGETWAAGRPQDDDTTFVVFKVKDKT